MVDSPSESPAESDSETGLLLANLDSALRALEKSDDAKAAPKSLQHLEQALYLYGSVKHLLPKLQLTADQRAPVERQLQELRAQILARSSAEQNRG